MRPGSKPLPTTSLVGLPPGGETRTLNGSKLELHGIGGAFRRYQALHYEALARNNQAGFDAHRVTITAPDGTEYSDVVWVDDETRAQLRDTVERA